MTSCHYVTEKRHQKNVTKFFHFVPPKIKISGYASAEHSTTSGSIEVVVGVYSSLNIVEMTTISQVL